MGPPKPPTQVTCPAADCLVELDPAHDTKEALRPPSFRAANAPHDLNTGHLGATGDTVQAPGVVERLRGPTQDVDHD